MNGKRFLSQIMTLNGLNKKHTSWPVCIDPFHLFIISLISRTSKALGKLFAFKEHQLCIILTLSSSFSTVLWWSLYFSCLGSRIKKSLFLFISEQGIESLKQETRILEQENPTLESGVSFMFVRKKFHHGVTFSWKIPSLKKTQVV